MTRCVSTELQVKKAIIVEEGRTTQLTPLTGSYPIWMFPFLNKPLIEYTIEFLRKNGLEDIIITLSGTGEIPDSLKTNKISGVHIKYYQEDRFRGTAGVLKDLEELIGQESFLVVNSNLFLGDIDLSKFIQCHMETDPMVTVGVYRDNDRNGINGNVIINIDKTIRGFNTSHPSADKEWLWRPSGIYLFNPSVLKFIEQTNYMDIKEQLIPILLREALKISAYEIENFHFRINNINDYTQLHRDLLLKNNHSRIVSITGGLQKLYNIAKRIMDIVLSSIGIVLLLPLFFLFAILIKIESPGPVLYIQKRCGKSGRLFGMIKFRSMVVNAENLQNEFIPLKETDGPMFKISNDPRITKLGRILRSTSIDELPQLFNVLKGEMSLVGPRPLITDEMKFSPTWRDIRLSVKPGMTGLWQVEARSSHSFQDWIKYDVDYVKNRSLWLDIKILLQTMKVVLKREGT